MKELCATETNSLVSIKAIFNNLKAARERESRNQNREIEAMRTERGKWKIKVYSMKTDRDKWRKEMEDIRTETERKRR